jgi:hypothetical protein
MKKRSYLMMHRFSFHHRLLPSLLLAATGVIVLAALVGTTAYARPTVHTTHPPSDSQGPCTKRICTFELQVNPGLQPGKPFACPAIQNARARITITNRFVTGAQNDIMVLTARGLPKNTGFDMFLVQNSPLDQGTFPGFGFGWYQSDIQSNSYGHAEVTVRGIFDQETFWFNSPDEEAKVCPSATPAKTPFNGEQNAGLLAMITQGEPLQFVVGKP